MSSEAHQTRTSFSLITRQVALQGMPGRARDDKLFHRLNSSVAPLSSLTSHPHFRNPRVFAPLLGCWVDDIPWEPAERTCRGITSCAANPHPNGQARNPCGARRRILTLEGQVSHPYHTRTELYMSTACGVRVFRDCESCLGCPTSCRQTLLLRRDEGE